MKYISFGVPSYNSEAYLRNCVDSLLVGGEDVEIIIINDGSKDKTLDICKEYAAKYPTIVKYVDQENSGHGEGVNQGLAHATGLYYKVVDSDDHLYKDGYLELLETIKIHYRDDISPDLYLCNFVYDHVLDNTQFVSTYSKYMKPNSFNTWKNIKHMHFSKMILMHSLVYKTETLIKSCTILPKHCFYVDNYFSYKPLIYCKSIFYLDVNLYSYFIGRSDQSINKANFVKRYDQQLKVVNLMIDSIKYDDLVKLDKGLKYYLKHALNVINIVTVAFCTIGDGDLKKQWKVVNDYFASIKKRDPHMYRFLKFRSYYFFVLLVPFKSLKKKLINAFYDFECRKTKVK